MKGFPSCAGIVSAMKEIVFIRKNIKEWQHIESMVDDLLLETPDEISDAYIRITSDLAFAQTHYPASRITLYLNNLAVVLHNAIYRNKRERRMRIVTFWTREVPLALFHARRLLLASFVIFVASVFIGVIAQAGDSDFCRIILGDSYMDETVKNISEGRPFAVYDGGPEGSMFYGITVNNVWVSFLVYISGIFTSIATGYLLFQNGVMVGCFETFFAQNGLLWPSVLSVFLHGTLELSAIIVAGSAGLAMGNGWLFPGTYSRGVAFRRGARRGVKIVVGTVPIFIVAGFIESYITRHTEIPDLIQLGIILLSVVFVVFYMIIYPRIVYNKSFKSNK